MLVTYKHDEGGKLLIFPVKSETFAFVSGSGA